MLLQGSSQAAIQCHQEQKVLDPSSTDILTYLILCSREDRVPPALQEASAHPVIAMQLLLSVVTTEKISPTLSCAPEREELPSVRNLCVRKQRSGACSGPQGSQRKV